MNEESVEYKMGQQGQVCFGDHCMSRARGEVDEQVKDISRH